MAVDAETAPTVERPGLAAFLRRSTEVRIIVAGYLISSVGYGLYLSGSAIYFVQSVGLSAGQVAAGLSAAGVAGLLLAVPLGQLADRTGPRRTTLWLTAAQVLLLCLATQVRTFLPFFAMIVALGIAETGANVSRGALIASVVDKGERVRLSAITRSVFNAGFSAGVLAAGLAIASNTRSAYLTLIVGNAVTTALVFVLYCLLPKRHSAGNPRSYRGVPRALKDLPFVAAAQVSKIVIVSETLITVGLPLWIVGHTQAPRAIAAWLIIVNTVMVVLLQTIASRPAETIDGAARLQRWAFLALAGSCVLLTFTGGLEAVWAVPSLILVVVLATLGEMWGDSAAWAIRFEFAPHNAQGEYGGVFALGTAIPAAMGPLLATSLPDRFGGIGWIGLIALFAIGYALSAPAVAWVRRTRPADE